MEGLESIIKAARAKGISVEICKDHLDLAKDQGHQLPSPFFRLGSS